MDLFLGGRTLFAVTAEADHGVLQVLTGRDFFGPQKGAISAVDQMTAAAKAGFLGVLFQPVDFPGGGFQHVVPGFGDGKFVPMALLANSRRALAQEKVFRFGLIVF